MYIVAFQQVTASSGFGWGVRCLAFIAIGIAAVAFPALLVGTDALAKARTARKLFDKTAFRDRGFLIFTASTVTTYLGYIVPYFFMTTFARDALGIKTQYASYILVISVGASFFGRLFIGVMAFHLGATVTWFLCALVSGVLCLAWIAVQDRAGLIAFSVLPTTASCPLSHNLAVRYLIHLFDVQSWPFASYWNSERTS